MLTFYDLFGGIGGFRLGMERQGHRCVGYCDIDKYAVKCYNENFREGHEPEDITTKSLSSLPDFDVLCGGSPCQSFSVAGQCQGLKDPRGQLLHTYIQVLQYKQPKYFLYENVAGLLNNEEGGTFSQILRAMGTSGYDVSWRVYSALDFGLPQNRKRLFIVGYNRSKCKREVLPLPTVVRVHNEESGQDQFANCLDSNYHKGWMDHGQRTHVIINGRIRRLSPVECERIMGFPDGWTSMLSDMQRYKKLGNAVIPDIVEYISKVAFL